MNFDRIIYCIVGESIKYPIFEDVVNKRGRKSRTETLASYLKINTGKDVPTDKFKQYLLNNTKQGKQIFFFNPNAEIAGEKYWETSFNPADVFAQIFKNLEKSPMWGEGEVTFATADLFDQDKSPLKEPVKEALSTVGGKKLSINPRTMAAFKGTMRTLIAFLASEAAAGSSFIHSADEEQGVSSEPSNTDVGSIEDISLSSPNVSYTPKATSEKFVVTKSIRDPEIKSKLISQFDDEVYKALRHTPALVQGNKAGFSDIAGDLRASFAQEGIRHKPSLVIDYLKLIEVLTPADQVKDIDGGEADEMREIRHKRKPGEKIPDLDLDMFIKDKGYDDTVMTNYARTTGADKDFEASNW